MWGGVPTAQIGPGELIGVQYERAEPGGRDGWERYRAAEENPRTGACPMNWVYVGRFQCRLSIFVCLIPIILIGGFAGIWNWGSIF